MRKNQKPIPDELKDKLKKEPQPEWVNPMLAKLTHDEFSDKQWIYERKLDGVRCLLFRDGKKVNVFSRNGNNLNRTYPEIVEACRKQPEEKFIIDGELVAFRGKVSSFAELQKRIGLTKAEDVEGHATKVFYYVFDLIHLRDLKVSQLPVLQRKELLQDFLEFRDPIRYIPHREERGLEFFQEACLNKWEGLIAKKADSKYSFGRSSNWLKFKCTNQQELVIGGYTEPTGSRTGFGALLLGYYEDGKLLYAGKVGTGFTDDLLERLHKKMSRIKSKEAPFSNAKQIRSKNVHWLKPVLVGQVSFTERTSGNKLRHPSFLGLREDKEATEVKRETES